MDDTTIIALEIGSSKIRGAVGLVSPDGTLTVKIVEDEALVDSVRYGQVNNIKVAAGSVERILRKIQNRLGTRKITGVYLGIGGRSLSSIPAEVERKLPPETEVTADLIDRLKLEVRSGVRTEKDILEVVPREFFIDNTREDHPEGRICSDIRMAANLITCRPQLKRNLDLLVVDKLQLKVNGYIIRPLAEADLVLTTDEKRLGCMMVDFGAETTTVAIYRQGALQYLATLPLGSRNITRDLTTLNTVEEDAEELKKSRGSAILSAENAEMDLSSINNLVSHRAGEIIANIKEQIKYASLTPAELPGGVILIGRGALLAGFSTRLENELGMKVRSGSSTSALVRIGDGRIPSDAVDIISLLLTASKAPVECLTPEEKPVETEVIPEEPPVKTDTKKSGSRFKNIWNSITKALDSEEDDDDWNVDDEE
ncbi:MAG: hypothetical protein HFJ94_07650 [Muribaculaceae bacterium]|nr:hypothetical protein [Muribaculaceae bacterium]